MKTLKTLPLICAAAALVSLLVSCGEQSLFRLDGTYEFPVEEDNSSKQVITSYNLQDYVAAPTTNAAPVREFARPDILVSAAWQNDATTSRSAASRSAVSIEDAQFTFAEGGLYKADITLTAAKGYEFSPDFTFYYLSEKVYVENEPNDPQVRLVTVHYPATSAPIPITDRNLTDKVPAPVQGGTAVGYFGGPEYTGTVEWSGIKAGGIFAAGATYTATVTLNPAVGYTLSGGGGGGALRIAEPPS